MKKAFEVKRTPYTTPKAGSIAAGRCGGGGPGGTCGGGCACGNGGAKPTK